MGKVTIEIDGISLEAEAGSMIIETADAAGLPIPRFCYHKKLSVAANCRMCLIEVSNLPKAVPACATPVADGMKIHTASAKARVAQKSVMEFLLINHPLDCPICDQGGECELQDVAMGYGNDVSRFTEGKRVVKDKNIGPLIETDMTRCIHCTRCVRFGTEVAGIREMGAVGRGEHMEISTYIEKSIASEVSGNIIDLCPVGALTAKPSRYRARAWELQTTAAVAPHDCLGTNIEVHHRRGEVIRVVPRENETINEVWVSDRDRFSYDALNLSERLLEPKIKLNGQWQTCDWETALNKVHDGFKQLIDRQGAESIGALISPSSTLEEMYLTQKLMRGIGCHNIDHRLRQVDFSIQHEAPLYPGVDFNFSDLDEMECSLLIGADLRKDQPLLAIRLRKSTRYGQVMAINPYSVDYNFKTSVEINVPSAELIGQLQGVVAALIERHKQNVNPELVELFDGVEVSEQHQLIAKNLAGSENTCVIVGQSSLEHSQSGHIRWLATQIAKLTNSSYGELTPGANTAGGHIAGAIPHRIECGIESDVCGRNILQMLQQGLAGYLLVNTEPELDSSYRDAARLALLKAKFVTVMTPFAKGEFTEYADVLLPIAGFTETSGTFVNAMGSWQSFSAAVTAKGSARPAWKVLRVLGNLFELANFEFTSSDQVLRKLREKFAGVTDARVGHLNLPESLSAGGEIPRPLNIFDSDQLTRRSPSLQATPLALANWRRDQIESLVSRAGSNHALNIDPKNIIATDSSDSGISA